MAEDLTKLPKWAQSKIQTLEMRISELQRKLEDKSVKDSNTIMADWVHGDIGLGRFPRIIFQSPKFGSDQIEVHMSDNEEFVHISARESAVGIQPQSSNLIRVRPERWW